MAVQHILEMFDVVLLEACFPTLMLTCPDTKEGVQVVAEANPLALHRSLAPAAVEVTVLTAAGGGDRASSHPLLRCVVSVELTRLSLASTVRSCRSNRRLRYHFLRLGSAQCCCHIKVVKDGTVSQ